MNNRMPFTAQDVAVETEIFRCEVGSKILGLGIGTDDIDQMGLCLEPPSFVIGNDRVYNPVNGHNVEFQQWVWRTQPEGVRSGPGDVDLTIYSFKKWMRLAMKGNPSVLLPLYAPPGSIVKDYEPFKALREDCEWMISRSTAGQYLGYVQSQRRQLLGEVPNHHVKRQDLIDAYGFDTKFAYHMVRLAMQGVELLKTATLTLPIPSPEREWLLRLRTGEVPMQEAVDITEGYEHQIEALHHGSTLRPTPDWARANGMVVRMYQDFWHEIGYFS